MNLASLGLTAEQERVYRYFLRAPGASVDAAAADLGIPHAPTVVARLKTMGIIDDGLAPVSPTVAVDLLIRRRMEQTTRELNQLSAAWDIVRDLTEEQRSGRPVELVERIEGMHNVNRRAREMSASSRELMNIKPAPMSHGISNTTVQHFRKRLSNGLISRTLIGIDSLGQPDQMAYAQQQHALGDLHRVTAEYNRRVSISDRAIALIQVDPVDVSVGALLVRQPGMVAALIDMFEGMWARARELTDPPLSAIERQVLQALALYDKDEVAARALNISLRKFRSHVADLMRRLRAGNRFQAALLAKERGWL
ncbi:LuxR C-terminal-related transcriptional regulator [Micromonospora sp. KC213]|uniref:LuxR C-terminal-related transcriptional regulator n=1 Tax=Micromonospora sp. KC213 TaxID=2530378 RepID=UPI00104B0B45|nr:LuxR C-terminal-related transcriptional regulator [Micromonospora sp. KC213]TDC43001.1 hypothetical protein E1166_05495 [Micromonospora sp. KC213]